MRRVAIFGGGIGGLTTAHELSKFPEYQITIYEKKNNIGGLARSRRDENGCAAEISWRVFFDFYKNLFKIMGEIPFDKNNSLLNNFAIYRHTNIYDNPFLLKDKLQGLYTIFKGCTSCDDRLNELDNLTWWNALNTTSQSNLMREIGEWLGMDRMKGSYKSVIKVGFEMNIIPKFLTNTNLSNVTYNDWVTTMPTSEALFDPWKIHLQNNNVKINLNNQLVSVQTKNNKIISASVYDSNNNKLYNVEADYYIFALPVEILNGIIQNTPELNYGSLQHINQLANSCLHIQLSFQIYFDRKISLGEVAQNGTVGENNGFLIIESPWDLIILQYDQLYSNTQLCFDIPNAIGGWSVTVCTAYTPGIVFNKPFNQCSYEESVIEIWAQIMGSSQLRKLIVEKNGFDLDKNMIIKWTNFWPTYNYDSVTKKLITSEPKFTNNAGSYALRPSFKTHINNLYIATAYIKETIDIFSMEAAAIAGKFVANHITNKSPGPYLQKRPGLFAPFRMIDTVSYNIGLPNLSFLIILLIVIVIIWLIFF